MTVEKNKTSPADSGIVIDSKLFIRGFCCFARFEPLRAIGLTATAIVHFVEAALAEAKFFSKTVELPVFVIGRYSQPDDHHETCCMQTRQTNATSWLRRTTATSWTKFGHEFPAKRGALDSRAASDG